MNVEDYTSIFDRVIERMDKTFNVAVRRRMADFLPAGGGLFFKCD